MLKREEEFKTVLLGGAICGSSLWQSRAHLFR